MKNVAILGVSHFYQLGPPDCSVADTRMFQEAIRSIVREHEIELVAEELHPDYLYGRENSTCVEIAKSEGADHLYFDMSRSERVKFNIVGPSDVKIMTGTGQIRAEDAAWTLNRSLSLRELYWITALLERNLWPALLIIGSDHVDSMERKLKTCNIDPKLVFAFWEPGIR